MDPSVDHRVCCGVHYKLSFPLSPASSTPQEIVGSPDLPEGHQSITYDQLQVCTYVIGISMSQSLELCTYALDWFPGSSPAFVAYCTEERVCDKKLGRSLGTRLPSNGFKRC